MPNHVTNNVFITGTEESLNRFCEKYLNENEEFTFNKVIPLPESLEMEEGSNTEKAISAYRSGKDDGEKHDFGLGVMSYYEAGKIYLENLEKYGAKTWYDWCYTHWGTKWDAYEQCFARCTGRINLNFCTAWSMPEPIFEKIAQDNPKLKFEIVFADEDYGYNCGSQIYVNGECVEDVYYDDGSDEARKLASVVLGYDYEEAE